MPARDDARTRPLHEAGDAETGGRQSLNVEGPAAASTQVRGEYGLSVQVGVFVFFSLMRALHPLVVKTAVDPVTKKVKHEGISVPLVESLLTIVVAQIVALGHGGLSEWKMIWHGRAFGLFSVVGVILGLGDYLELQSLGNLSGAAYQVLCQSKMIITAFMLWGVKGQKQSPMQWILLILLTLSLCCFVIVKELMMEKQRNTPNAAVTDDDPSLLIKGAFWTLMKVFVSCLTAVLLDKFMKDFKDEPIHVQLAQFKVAWFFTLLLLSFFVGNAWEHGMFHDWTVRTGLATASFAVKNWSSAYLLAILDSLLKNVGEASAVILTYFLTIFHPEMHDKYENETFIAVLMVFCSVVAYLLSKSDAAKLAKFDQWQARQAGRS